ncbi:MAG: MFS transporter [Granulosicoccus sp.]|nr:MFS transporter [Granulosicoccus sp.]
MLYFVAGCTSAIHVGKIPTALPELTEHLGLSLVGASLIVSLFSMLSAGLGLLAGVYAVAACRGAALTGFLCAGIASLVGIISESLTVLLLTRAVEGLGWILVAVTMPVLLAAVSNQRDKPLVMGIWGAFMPLGITVTLLLSPMILESGGWRLLWQFSGLASLIAGLLVAWASRRVVLPEPIRLQTADIVATIWRPAPLLMFACFLTYSAQFMAVTSFLPTLLLERYPVTLAMTAQWAALVVAANIIGNVAAGWLLRRGFTAASLLIASMFLMGVSAAAIFSGLFSLVMTVCAATVFTAAGGLIPGTLFASAQKVVSAPVLAGVVIGLILQAAGLGQLIGPPLMTTIVEWADDWAAAILYTTLMSLSGLICALCFMRVPMEPSNTC